MVDYWFIQPVVNHLRWFVETPAHIAGIYLYVLLGNSTTSSRKNQTQNLKSFVFRMILTNSYVSFWIGCTKKGLRSVGFEENKFSINKISFPENHAIQADQCSPLLKINQKSYCILQSNVIQYSIKKELSFPTQR